MAPLLLEVKDITKHYDSIPVLSHASLTLEAGEILGVVGKNASAKSTFIKILSGAVPMESGQVFLNGTPVRIKSPVIARKLGIFTIYDGAVPFLDHFTVADNLFLGNYTQKQPASLGLYRKKALHAKAQELLDQYGLDISASQTFSALSQGQKQMVFLVHALSQGLRILIIDNCFSALDANEIQILSRLLVSLKEQGIAVLLTSQNLESLTLVADSLVVLDNGTFSKRISQDEKKDFIPKYFSQAQPYPKLSSQCKEIFFQCVNICFQERLKDITFSLRRGEILGILGNSNSGRTTLSRVLCGDLPAEIGKIYMNQQEIRLRSPVDAHRHKIAIIKDTASSCGLIPGMNVPFNITINHIEKISVGRIFVSRTRQNKDSRLLVDRLGIKYHWPNQPTIQLSAGNRQKVAFARAIYSSAEVFLLDEPTKGIDKAGKIQIDSLIGELARKGKGLILFSSDIEEAMSLCDRILILNSGKITGALSREEFTAESLMEGMN
ncbi:MAG: ATP-binding cassette domain-containing protein [Blautia sp.]|jgi:ribose transport system ATP-binding protein